MRYDLYITRARDWSRNQEARISFDEWLALVDDDPELSFDDAVGPAFARWDGFSSQDEIWFEWRHGNIGAKYADEFVVEKMLEIARAIGARLQGECGEEYPGPEDDPYWLEASRSERKRSARARGGWRRLLARLARSRPLRDR